MRILIVNHYSGSLEMGMEYRHFCLAQEFKKLGHDVCIVASAYSHLRNKQPKDENIGPQISSHNGIDHIWLTGCQYFSNGSRRLLNMLGFSFALWWHAKKITAIWKPDVVYASSPHPLQSYSAVRLARVAYARLVFEIRDLWPLSLVELAGVSRWHPVIRLFNHAEQYGCNHADAVISLLPAVADYMKLFRNLPLNKLHIIPNGISLDDWNSDLQPICGELRNYIKEAQLQGNIIVGYAGSHGLPNALDTLLDAAALLKDRPVSFVLVGGGHERNRLLQRVEQEKLKNVKMFPQILRNQIPSFLQLIDVAYIGWQRQPIYRFGIAPNKLMDYMMAGCAVLHSVDSGNDLVFETGCGITVSSESPQAIYGALCHFIGMSASEREKMGGKGKAYVKANHDYNVLAKRFLSIIKHLN